jgi:hypothetical protein
MNEYIKLIDKNFNMNQNVFNNIVVCWMERFFKEPKKGW